MKVLFSLLFILQSINAFSLDFGEEIQLVEGKGAFGVVFTLGSEDPDGNSWLIRFQRKGAFKSGVKWNVWVPHLQRFVSDSWLPGVSGPFFQGRLKGEDAAILLPHQADIVLVFDDGNGVSSYLPVGKMCGSGEFEESFKNLTNLKRCHEVTAGDVTTSTRLPITKIPTH